MSERRLFTLDEARAALADAIPLLRTIQSTVRELEGLRARVALEVRGATADGNFLTDPWAAEDDDPTDALMTRLQDAAARLEEMGIELKDPGQGLIDFSSERDGSVVYLCYLLGEPDIAHWHRVEDGFAGRRPL